MRISEKEQKQKLNIFFIVEFVASAAMVLATTRQIGSIASAAFTGSFLLLVAWFAKMVLLDGQNHHLAITFLIVMLSTICAVVSAILNEEGMTMAYFTDHLVFLSTILYLFVIMNTETNEKTCRILLVINVAVAYVYPIAYRLFPQGNKFSGLYLNFSNPNLTGMWILQAILYASIALLVIESIGVRLLALVSIPINVWLLFKTEARNCMVALVLFAVLGVWAFFKQNPRFSNGLVWLINLLPILFVPLYLMYIEVVIEKGWLEAWGSAGKELDSRVWIWNNRLDAIEGLWLIGNYSGAGGNAHNSHMVLLSSYGIFGLALGTYFLGSICTELNEAIVNRKNMYALVAFFAVIFIGLGEGALFAGGMGIFIPACGFLLLAKCDFGEDKRIVLPWSKKKNQST